MSLKDKLKKIDIYKSELDKKKLSLKDSIKGIGTYHVEVKLHAKVTAELTVRVDGQ